MADADKLLAFLEESGLSFRQNSVSYILNCPRCEKANKLYMRKSNGQFICFYCCEISGFKGRPEYALADLCQRPIETVRKALYASANRDSGEYFDLQLDRKSTRLNSSHL